MCANATPFGPAIRLSQSETLSIRLSLSQNYSCDPFYCSRKKRVVTSIFTARTVIRRKSVSSFFFVEARTMIITKHGRISHCHDDMLKRHIFLKNKKHQIKLSYFGGTFSTICQISKGAFKNLQRM